jgi:hypothetical protein
MTGLIQLVSAVPWAEAFALGLLALGIGAAALLVIRTRTVREGA